MLVSYILLHVSTHNNKQKSVAKSSFGGYNITQTIKKAYAIGLFSWVRYLHNAEMTSHLKYKPIIGGNMKLSIKIIAIALAVLMLVPSLACKDGAKKYEVPKELTREEAALYTAVAAVCPKDDNHSKVEYLTFHIEGWSFTEIPDEVQKYIGEYASNGKAVVVPLTFEELIEQGYIVKGDGDFFSKDENTYKLGKGKIFTFTKAGDSDADSLIIKLTGFISDNDSSGYDIELTWKDGKWNVEGFTNPWGAAYMNNTADPGAPISGEPIK